MLVTLVGAVLVRTLASRNLARHFAAAVCVLAGALCVVWPEPAWIAARGHDREFWEFAFRGLPTAFWALAIALTFAVGGKLPKTPLRLAVAGGVALVAALLAQRTFGATKLLRAVSGLGALSLALYPMRTTGLAWLGAFGQFSFGIYLSHVVFLRVVTLWTERYDIKPSLALDVFAFLLAFFGGLVLTMLLCRSRWKKWTLGE